MYISATSELPSDAATRLHSEAAKRKDADVLVLSDYSPQDGSVSWVSHKRGSWLPLTRAVTREGRGIISEHESNGVEIAAHAIKIFCGDRTPYMGLLGKLARPDGDGWIRTTYVGDCRLAGAAWLADEQAWCQQAFERDGKPRAPTAYIVKVLGSVNYFGYFNIYWAQEDSSHVKCCHDLTKWASVYIPNMVSKRNVERWNFLLKEDYEAFGQAVRGYRKTFAFTDFPYPDGRPRV
jgi:hypothetical protein